jgi:hypothetical protein
MNRKYTHVVFEGYIEEYPDLPWPSATKGDGSDLNHTQHITYNNRIVLRFPANTPDYVVNEAVVDFFTRLERQEKLEGV